MARRRSGHGRNRVYNEDVLRTVERTIARYGMFRPGERVAVAVSGGPDSVALLYALRQLAPALEISLSMAHLNHQLRGAESAEDERFVAELAARLGLRLHQTSVDTAAEARLRRENLEQVGRKTRYQWFTQLRENGFTDKIAVGHTRSDQAETVLFRLLRGSGSSGLAGIRPVLQSGVVRPLIGVGRDEVLRYLRSGGQPWREDSSNQNTEFDRNRIRVKLMPLLEKEWNPNIEATLARMADCALAEEEYWESAIEPLRERRIEQGPDGVYLRASEWKDLDVASQRRLLRSAVGEVRGNLLGIDFVHLEALRELVCSDRRSGTAALPGLQAVRSFDRVRLERPDAVRQRVKAEYCFDVAPPGEVPVPGGGTVLVLKLLRRADLKYEYNGELGTVLDWRAIGTPLRLRNWRPGDRYCPSGRTGTKKLKKLFQESETEVWKRAGWPVVTASLGGAERETIVWTRKFGPAKGFQAREDSDPVLHISEVERF